jgi:hypothetical protein
MPWTDGDSGAVSGSWDSGRGCYSSTSVNICGKGAGEGAGSVGGVGEDTGAGGDCVADREGCGKDDPSSWRIQSAQKVYKAVAENYATSNYYISG